MKNVQKPTSALASIRARLGLTQEQMGEQLGISRSMIKMVETARRFLSSDALVKLAALEIRMTAMPSVAKSALPACVKELYDNENKEYAEESSGHETNCKYKALQQERKLAKMKAEHDDLVSCLQNIEAVCKTHHDDNSKVLYPLLLTRTSLLQKLSRCSPQAQAIVKNKIPMLYAEVSLKKSIHPRYVHTNEEPIII
jgi:transcriptional regulator with XRE-family HTH domain